MNKIGFVENMKRKNNLSKRLEDRVKKFDVRNISLFSFIGVATSACNVSEDDIVAGDNSYVQQVTEYARSQGDETVSFCAKIEAELAELDDDERTQDQVL